jgi:hypothetical protein
MNQFPPKPLNITLGPFQICSKICHRYVDSGKKFEKVASRAYDFSNLQVFRAQSAIAIPQISEISESPNFKSANFVGEPACKFSTIRQRELNIFFFNSLSL